MNLEELLRSFASAALPEAANPSVEFLFSADYAGRAEIADFGPPACPRVSDITAESAAAGSKYLGRFRAGEIPSGCADDSRCRMEAVAESVGQYGAAGKADFERARRIGELELARLIPGSIAGCLQPGCAKIEVALAAGLEAEAEASYVLPLYFPASAFFRTDSVTVAYRSRERLELPLLAKKGD